MSGRLKRGKPVHDLIRRNRALEKVRLRFEGKPFVFGKNDCLQLVRHHLVQMGHRRLPPAPRYSTAVGARLALRRQGADTLEQLLDQHLEAIPPAMMLPGDIGLVTAETGDGDDDFGETLVISLGQKVWGWHPEATGLEVLILAPSAITKAWRA